MGSFDTIRGFWELYNNIPLLNFNGGRDTVLSKMGIIVNAFSMFQADILPEWEHPVNAQGSGWGSRQAMTDIGLRECWLSLLLAAIGEQFVDGVVGVRVINKSNSGRSLHKLEIWMQRDTLYCNSNTTGQSKPIVH